MAQSDQREGRGSGSEEAQLASLEAGSTSLLETASAKVLC